VQGVYRKYHQHEEGFHLNVSVKWNISVYNRYIHC
jgi:hypothetical protein